MLMLLLLLVVVMRMLRIEYVNAAADVNQSRSAPGTDDRSVRKRRRQQRSLGRGSLTVARRRRRTAVMKYIRRSRAVINVAKSPSRLRRTLDARAPVDDVLSSYIGIILPRAAAAAAPLASALYTASC